ncbi:unnamed protein product [Durusdinium trenchii]|uniref:Uncharacterized protein n=1 Tax=Durusdinium trenchii TaxID=1381693 RepID=A0ABP0JG20_9DINO
MAHDGIFIDGIWSQSKGWCKFVRLTQHALPGGSGEGLGEGAMGVNQIIQKASLAVERNDDGGLPRQPGGRQAGSARKQPPEIEGPVPKDLRDADLVEDELRSSCLSRARAGIDKKAARACERCLEPPNSMWEGSAWNCPMAYPTTVNILNLHPMEASPAMAPLWRGAVASLPLALVAEVPDEGAMKIREGLAAVEWCAMMMNFQPQELPRLSSVATKCPRAAPVRGPSEGEDCLRCGKEGGCIGLQLLGLIGAMELADSVGAKCCRSAPGTGFREVPREDTEMSGFYGFLLPPRSFSLTPGRLKLRELRALGLLGTEEGHMVSLHATTSPPLMDVVQVNSLAEEPKREVPIFYHRLFHEYAEAILRASPLQKTLHERHVSTAHLSPQTLGGIASVGQPDSICCVSGENAPEVAPQALWEYTHYVQHRQSFRPLARRGRGCEQPEAAEAKAMADTTALPWLALRWLERGNPPFNSFVNLGARDGVGDDPLQFLLQDPRHVDFALAVEMDPEYCQRHRQHLPHVQVLCLQVSEATMPEILQKVPRAARRPKYPQAARQYLGAIPLRFLSSVRAKLVVLEVFDGLPPPLRFSLHEHPQLASWGGLTVWGCSLSYQVRMLKPLGYHLVWYGAGNAIYVHRSVSTRLGLPRLDEVDCYVTSVVMAMWPSGRRMRRWFYEVRSCDRWWRHIGVTRVKRPGII